MGSSSLKRVAFPILGGIGQAGWAIAVLVLGPIIARLLPHWDVDLPDWSLPQVHLPVPDLPIGAGRTCRRSTCRCHTWTCQLHPLGW